jgi:hypothetical protein
LQELSQQLLGKEKVGRSSNLFQSYSYQDNMVVAEVWIQINEAELRM